MRISNHSGLLFFGCLLMAGWGTAVAETILYEKNIVSRECTIYIENESVDYPDAVSREISLQVHNGPIFGSQSLSTRACSLVITTEAAPDPVTELTVDLSPTGQRVVLDWSDYNELLQDDVLEYRIYISTSPFTDVSGMTPYATVAAGNKSVEINGLPAWTDHYFAVVAVDEPGNYNTGVQYAAAYVLSPELVSREYSVNIGSAAHEPQRSTLSREYTQIIQTPEAPAAIPDFSVESSPTGDAALLDWSSYNELLERDIVRYDIYYSASPFTSVAGMTPYTTVNAGNLSVLLSGLAPWTDHYFAVVPVDAAGSYNPSVNYGAAYGLSPELVSREYSLFIKLNSVPEHEVCSRETTLVIGTDEVPDAVTGLSNLFTVVQSVNDYQSLDVNWSGYNELIQRDLVRYRIYLSGAYFDDVTGMEPFTHVPAGTQSVTLTGLDAFGVYHVAVVAEDVLGNFNPVVRSESGQASTAGVGEVQNLQVVCGKTSLTFSWEPPQDSGVFLDAYNIYFAGAADPLVLAPSNTSLTVTNLLKAHGYPFRITTTDIFDTETGGLILLAATLFDNPTNVAAYGLDQQVSLIWDEVEAPAILEHYAVYQSDVAISNVYGMTPINTTTDSSLLVGGLVNFSNYHFAVVAVNVAGGFDTNVQSVVVMPEPDLVGAHVTGFRPDEPFRIDDSNVDQLFSGFRLTFSEPVNPASLTLADLSVSNAAGAIAIESITERTPAEYHVRLVEAYLAGSNTVSVGTNILDVAGNPMTAPFSTVVMLSNPALPPGAGDGLLGTYYDGTSFEGTSYLRIDPALDFDWHANAPIPEIGTDSCSIRWTGRIEPRYDGNYVFTLAADDGVRLWVDGTLIIDDWTIGSGLRVSTNVYLTNDQRYDIQIEYFEQTADAHVQLQWQFETLPNRIVPQSQLYTGLPSSEFVATPVMSPPAGIYYGITDVSLSSATTNAQIFYTQGDSESYADWTLYDGNAIRLISNAVIRAIAVKEGLNDSGVRVAEYDISLVPVPDYDWWKTVNFFGITNEAIIGRTADPDSDGIPNIVEYAYCLDPNSNADPRALTLDLGDVLNHWMVHFTMPGGQSSGAFRWSSNLVAWADIMLEETNSVWFAESNLCEVTSQNANELTIDTRMNSDQPIFFRLDCTQAAVTNMNDMDVYPEDRNQEWFAVFHLRAEDPTIQPFIEIRPSLTSGDWQAPAVFSYSNNVWTVDQPEWSISSQTEELYSEWMLRVKLPDWPLSAPVFLRTGVRDYSE
ncbi:PA14 domain-containing protein [Pontiellaceae bacterium B12227]|nr:PA14 domain-containing protein [Pontiellaceae bacterium B12227]